MKLRSSLPERPSSVLLGPMLNLLLILVLVSFKSSALKPSATGEPPETFTLKSSEKPFLVTVPASIQTAIYLDRRSFNDLDEMAIEIKRLRDEAESQGRVRNSVILEIDRAVATEMKESVQKRLVDLGFQVAILNEGAAL